MRQRFTSVVATVTLLVYSTTQVAFASRVETTLWSERSAARRQVQARGSRDAALASLPGSRPVALSSVLSAPAPLRMDQRFAAAARAAAAAKGPSGGLAAAVPLTNGTVSETFDGSPAGPVIAVLQDVHLNPEAQENLASVLSRLATDGGVTVIGVEGAFGEFDFTRFRAFEPTVVSKVARGFLEKGLIAAPSYLGLTSPRAPPRMIGVDDEAQYRANVRAYLDSRAGRFAAAESIRRFEAAADRIRKKEFSPALKEIDDLRRAYRAGSIGMGAYLERLATRAPRRGPAMAKFLDAYAIEKKLDFARADRERRALLERLAVSLSEAETSALMDDTLAYRSGGLGFGDYYRRLRTLFERKGIDLRAAPAFDAYVRYVILADGIRPAELFGEIETLEDAAVSALARTDREKAALAVADYAHLAGKLAGFELTPREWERYRKIKTALASLPREWASGDLAFRLPGHFESFYREADARSESMITALLSAAGSGRAALVTGGFHSPEIAAALRARNVSYVVVTPRLTKVDEGSASAYLSVFAREKTTLDRLFAGEKLFLGPVDANLSQPRGRLARLTLLELVFAALTLGFAVPPESGVSGRLAGPQTAEATFVGEPVTYRIGRPRPVIDRSLEPSPLGHGDISVSYADLASRGLATSGFTVWFTQYVLAPFFERFRPAGRHESVRRADLLAIAALKVAWWFELVAGLGVGLQTFLFVSQLLPSFGYLGAMLAAIASAVVFAGLIHVLTGAVHQPALAPPELDRSRGFKTFGTYARLDLAFNSVIYVGLLIPAFDPGSALLWLFAGSVILVGLPVSMISHRVFNRGRTSWAQLRPANINRRAVLVSRFLFRFSSFTKDMLNSLDLAVDPPIIAREASIELMDIWGLAEEISPGVADSVMNLGRVIREVSWLDRDQALDQMRRVLTGAIMEINQELLRIGFIITSEDLKHDNQLRWGWVTEVHRFDAGRTAAIGVVGGGRYRGFQFQTLGLHHELRQVGFVYPEIVSFFFLEDLVRLWHEPVIPGADPHHDAMRALFREDMDAWELSEADFKLLSEIAALWRAHREEVRTKLTERQAYERTGGDAVLGALAMAAGIGFFPRDTEKLFEKIQKRLVSAVAVHEGMHGIFIATNEQDVELMPKLGELLHTTPGMAAVAIFETLRQGDAAERLDRTYFEASKTLTLMFAEVLDLPADVRRTIQNQDYGRAVSEAENSALLAVMRTVVETGVAEVVRRLRETTRGGQVPRVWEVIRADGRRVFQWLGEPSPRPHPSDLLVPGALGLWRLLGFSGVRGFYRIGRIEDVALRVAGLGGFFVAQSYLGPFQWTVHHAAAQGLALYAVVAALLIFIFFSHLLLGVLSPRSGKPVYFDPRASWAAAETASLSLIGAPLFWLAAMMPGLAAPAILIAIGFWIGSRWHAERNETIALAEWTLQGLEEADERDPVEVARNPGLRRPRSTDGAVREHLRRGGEDPRARLMREMRRNGVVGLGETHPNPAEKRFAADMLPHLYAAGARFLVLELPVSHQSDVDAFLATGDMSERLLNLLARLPFGGGRPAYIEMMRVVRAINAAHPGDPMRIEAVDPREGRYERDMDEETAARVLELKNLNRGGIVIVFGAFHVAFGRLMAPRGWGDSLGRVLAEALEGRVYLVNLVSYGADTEVDERLGVLAREAGVRGTTLFAVPGTPLENHIVVEQNIRDEAGHYGQNFHAAVLIDTDSDKPAATASVADRGLREWVNSVRNPWLRPFAVALYWFYTVVLVNWETVVFQGPLYLIMWALPGWGHLIALALLPVSAALFASAHPDVSAAEWWKLFAVGLGLGGLLFVPGVTDAWMLPLIGHSLFNLQALIRRAMGYEATVASVTDASSGRSHGDRLEILAGLVAAEAKFLESGAARGRAIAALLERPTPFVSDRSTWEGPEGDIAAAAARPEFADRLGAALARAGVRNLTPRALALILLRLEIARSARIDLRSAPAAEAAGRPAMFVITAQNEAEELSRLAALRRSPMGRTARLILWVESSVSAPVERLYPGAAVRRYAAGERLLSDNRLALAKLKAAYENERRKGRALPAEFEDVALFVSDRVYVDTEGVDAATLRSLVIIYIDALLRGTVTRGALDRKMKEISASLLAKMSA